MTANDLFFPKDHVFTEEEEAALAREELIYNVTEDLLIQMEGQGISKIQLAEQLSRSRSYVSQLLSGTRNMTLGTLSDICRAIGAEPTVELKSVKEPSRQWSGDICSLEPISASDAKKVIPFRSLNSGKKHKDYQTLDSNFRENLCG